VKGFKFNILGFIDKSERKLVAQFAETIENILETSGDLDTESKEVIKVSLATYKSKYDFGK
jgi:hypothetical protein